MRLRITHDTRYDYQPAVETALHLLHLQPVDTPRQRVLDFALEVHPDPVFLASQGDAYGNVRAVFEIDRPHPMLHVRASSLVDTAVPPPVQSGIAWEAARDAYVYRAKAPYQPATEFISLGARAPARRVHRLRAALLHASAGRCWTPRAS